MDQVRDSRGPILGPKDESTRISGHKKSICAGSKFRDSPRTLEVLQPGINHSLGQGFRILTKESLAGDLKYLENYSAKLGKSLEQCPKS